MDLTSEFDRFEQQAWEEAGEAYRRGFSSLTDAVIPHLLGALAVGSGTRVLDVACGPGALTAEASRRGAAACGLDFAESMLSVARTLHPGIDVRVGDAHALPFPDQSFDAVAMNFGALHLSDPTRAFREAHRVLGPGGRYGFTVWDSPERSKGFEVILGAIRKAGEPDIPLPPGPPFFKYSDAEMATSDLREAGFKAVRVERISLIWNLPDSMTFFTTFLHGTARTGAVLRAQSDAQREAIRSVAQELLAPYKKSGGIEIPMQVVIAVGER
jgi:SAM-dependent methyltransferase